MTVEFCARCGTPMEPVALDGKLRPRCAACGFVRYRNPAPVGMALIDHHGSLVLIRRRAAPLADYWAPPAGYVESGESVTDAVIREAEEECGLRIAVGPLVGVFSQAGVDVLVIAYAARAVAGELRAGDDASDARLFSPGALPSQPAPARGTETDYWFHGVIEATLAHWRSQAAHPRKTP